MMPFVLVALIMTAIALGFVIHPLLRSTPRVMPSSMDNLQVLRDQADDLHRALEAGALTQTSYAEASEELARQVTGETTARRRKSVEAPSRAMAGFVACIVPLIAAGLYYYAGSPAAIAVANPQNEAKSPQHEITAADVSTLVQSLAERMRKEPTNADGWYMLARSYTAIGRYQDAIQAYQRLLVLVPDDSAVLADYADVLATVQGSLNGKPEELVLDALKHNPQDVKALALAGNAAYQRSDYETARARWQALLPLIPQDSALYQGTVASIAEIGSKSITAQSVESHQGAEKPTSSLTGTVSIAPELQAEVAPTDSVFIFARASQGPRTPLAVKRITASQLPYRFVLDDSLAMSSQFKLSSAREVIVTARISKSGTAAPKSGDWLRQTEPIPSSSRDILVQINSRIP